MGYGCPYGIQPVAVFGHPAPSLFFHHDCHVLGAGCRSALLWGRYEDGVSMRSSGHGPDLSSCIEVLRVFSMVGPAASSDRNLLSYYDLDLGDPFLAGKRVGMEREILWAVDGSFSRSQSNPVVGTGSYWWEGPETK